MGKQINFRCTEEEHAKLKRLADAQGQSMSAYLKAQALGMRIPVVRAGDEIRKAKGVPVVGGADRRRQAERPSGARRKPTLNDLWNPVTSIRRDPTRR